MVETRLYLVVQHLAHLVEVLIVHQVPLLQELAVQLQHTGRLRRVAAVLLDVVRKVYRLVRALRVAHVVVVDTDHGVARVILLER